MSHLCLLARRKVLKPPRSHRPQAVGVVRPPTPLQSLPPAEVVHSSGLDTRGWIGHDVEKEGLEAKLVAVWHKRVAEGDDLTNGAKVGLQGGGGEACGGCRRGAKERGLLRGGSKERRRL